MNWAARYVGTPFLGGGRDINGLDCFGLVVLAYREQLGIELPPYAEISASDFRRVSRQIEAEATVGPWRQVNDPQEFDVAVMRLPTGRARGHVGLMTDPRHVMHAEAGSGVAIEPVSAPAVCHRILSYWRHVTK